MNFKYKMALVTRKDLSLSKGKLAVQVAHAAVNCTLRTKKKKKNKWFKKWQREGGKKVVLKVDKLQDFYPLIEKAKRSEIVSYIVEDVGKTEVPSGTKTVLGIGPAPSNIIDHITGELSVL